MKKIYLAFVSILAFGFADAQTPVYQWALGNGSSTPDETKSVTIDKSGNAIIVGYFTGTADFDPSTGIANLTSNGDSDVFVAKYSSTGQYVWAFNIGGTGIDVATGVTIDDSNNVIICGYFDSGLIDFDPGTDSTFFSSSGNLDFFVAKYDSLGNYTTFFGIRGPSRTICNAICLDDSSNILITGLFDRTTDFDPGAGTVLLTKTGFTSDIFVAKYSRGFAYQWAFNIGSSLDDRGMTIAADSMGNVLVGGSFRSTSVVFDPGVGSVLLNAIDSSDIFIAKYSSTGSCLWAIGIGGSLDDQCNSVSYDAQDNVLATGYFPGSSIDFDPGVGSTLLSSSGLNDIFVAKYSQSGALLWAFPIGGTGNDEGLAICTDPMRSAFVSGRFANSADFDPSAGTTSLTSQGGEDIYLAQYDSTGTYKWAFNIGSTTDDCGNSITIDPSGNVYTAGYYSGNADFNPAAASNNLSSQGGTDAHIAQYHYMPVGIIPITALDFFVSIFPNPASSFIQISSNSLPIEKIIIVSTLGEVMYKGVFDTKRNSVDINIEKYSSGIYYAIIESNMGRAISRFIHE